MRFVCVNENSMNLATMLLGYQECDSPRADVSTTLVAGLSQLMLKIQYFTNFFAVHFSLCLVEWGPLYGDY